MSTGREGDGPPTILCIVNRPGWAHDYKTDALARALAGEFALRKRFQAEVTEEDVADADCVLLYFWLQLESLDPGLRPALARRRDRLLLGVCSEYELEGELRAPGLATLATLPRAVFVNNALLRERLGPALGRPVFYTPNGVDTRFFRPPPAPRPPGPLRVGWAGSLANRPADYRGVHDVIAPAVAAVPGAELRLAAREEVWRGPEEMLAFYHGLDVYVCASKSEGTPNPCLEAAACGLPLVTTRVGNMPELVRDGENGLFIEREVADLALQLERLRDDPELRARLGRAARASVEAEWDWARQAAHYAAMFRAVLAGAA